SLKDVGSVYVARSGTGSFNITAGGVVSSIRFVIGENSASDGTATISGFGSMWTNVAVCFVGFDGNGTLNITNGGQVSNLNSTCIGENGTGTVNVDGAGSIWTDDLGIAIGVVGAGTLTISNGGHISSFGGTIGSNPGSTGVVNVIGAGSSWTNNGLLRLSGDGGNGTLQIMSGGAASNCSCFLGDVLPSGASGVGGGGWTLADRGGLFLGACFVG